MVIAFALAGACEQRKAEPERLPETAGIDVLETRSENVPEVMRPGLRSAMGRHAEQASALTRAVALGLDEDVAQHASALLGEPSAARPLPNEAASLNDELPPKLFEDSEALRSALVDLRSSASAHESVRIVDRFATVLRACRDCHRAFGRQGGGGPER